MNVHERVSTGCGYAFRKKIDTTNYNYMQLVEDIESVRLGRTTPVQNITWSYTETKPEEIKVITTSTTEDCYISANGITAQTVSVAGGGSADNVTCSELCVSFTEDFSTLTTFYFDGKSSTPYKTTTDYSNFAYSFGSARNCTVNGTLQAFAGTISGCSVNGELYASGIHSFDYKGDESDVKYFSPDVANCTVNGTIRVDYGGKVRSSTLTGGEVIIGSDSEEREKELAKYGKAVVSDLTVTEGDVKVKYGGRLEGADINGALIATEGSELSGVITCRSLYLDKLASTTATLTIDVNLNDYALPVETRTETSGDFSIRTDYYADLHKKVTTREISTGKETISVSAFDPEKEGLSGVEKWRNVFSVNLGSIGDYALTSASDIIIDFGDSLANFDEGTITISGQVSGSAPPIRFKTKNEKFSLNLLEEGDWFTGFTYNAALYGYGYEVLWQDQGTETEYVIDLPDDCMGGAGENISIKARDDDGQIGEAEVLPAESLKDSSLTVKNIGTNDLVISGEDGTGCKHQCDLELWVVPEVIPGLDKAATGKFAELLNASQGNMCNFTCTWNNIHTELLGVDFALTDMGVTFTVTEDRTASLKMQGKLEWAISEERAGTGKNTKLVLDLSGDSYIGIRFPWKQNAVLDVVGSMTCPDFKIGKFGFSNVAVSMDTVSNSWKVSAYITLPCLKYAFGGEIGVVDGYWDSMTIGVDSLNVPLGTTGLMLQKITGSVKDIATSLDMTFGGSLGMTYGPVISVEDLPDWMGIDDGDYSLCELTVAAEICTDGTMTGTANFISLGNLISGNGSISASSGDFHLSGEFGMLNNCITVEGEFASGSGGARITGTGRVQVPAEIDFGILAGMGFSVNVHADFTSRYLLAWHESTVFGNSVSFGFRCTFDGDVDLLGTTSIQASPLLKKGAAGSGTQDTAADDVRVQFDLSGENVVFFQCTVTDGTLNTLLTDEKGTVYTQAGIIAGTYANMQVVQELTTATCITIAVNQPSDGTWTMTACGNETAVMKASSVVENPLALVVTSVKMGMDSRSVTLNYSLGNIDGLENVKVSVFCDSQEAGKLLLAEVKPTASTGTYTWVLSRDFSGGDYSFHLMAEADDLTPVESAVTDVYKFAILDTEAPDAITKVSVQWTDSGTTVSWDKPYDDTGVTGYCFRYGTDADNMEEIQLTGSRFVFDAVPNGSYYWQAAAYDASGNCSDWSELQECLVNVKANASLKNETFAEDIILAKDEGAVAIHSLTSIKTETDSLLADSVVMNAEIHGIAENLTVNGKAVLESGGQLMTATVNGELVAAANSAADGITVSNGGILSVCNRGEVSNVTVTDGGSLVLSQGSEYQNVNVDSGATLTFAGSSDVNTNRFLMSDDITTAGNVTLARYLYGNGCHLYLDVKTGHINDMSKIVGDVLVLKIDSLTAAGEYLIADNIASFSSELTVQSGTDAESIGFDSFTLVGDYGCKLVQYGNALYLSAADSTLAAPVVHVSGHDADSMEYFTVYFDSMAENSVKCKWRCSQNADMSDAMVSDIETINYGACITVNKDDFAGSTKYYLQACTQDSNGFWSTWSDAVQFTVTPKYLPLPPVISGAMSGSADTVTLTVSADERAASKYTFRYADNPEMKNAVNLYDYGTNTGYISKSSLEMGKTYYAQTCISAYGWGEIASFTIGNSADYENYTITSKDGYFTVAENELGINLTVADDPEAWCSVSGTVNGFTVKGGFARLDAGCLVTDMDVSGGKVWLSSGTVSDLTIQQGTEVRLMESVINNATIIGTLNADYNVTKPALTGDIVVQGTILLDVGNLAAQADFIFDIAAHKDKMDTMFISNTNVLTGMNTYSLRLSDTMETGDYALTWNEYADEITFTLSDELNQSIAVLTAECAPVLYNGLYYSIVNANIKTFLHVSDNSSPYTGKIQYYKNGTLCGTEGSISYGLEISEKYDIDYVFVDSNGQIRDSVVNAGGVVKVCSQASATEITVGSGGRLVCADGAVPRSITVQQGGTVVLGNAVYNSDIVLSGTMLLNGTLSSGSGTEQFYLNLIDMTSAPSEAMISDFTKINFTSRYIVNVSSLQINGIYRLLGNASAFSSYISLIVDGDSENPVLLYAGDKYQTGGVTYSLSKTDGTLQLTVTGGETGESSISGSSITSGADGASWESERETVNVIQYSRDNFRTVIEKNICSNEISTYNLPEQSYAWRVRCEDESSWVNGNTVTGEQTIHPKLFALYEDGIEDLIFTAPSQTWQGGYSAKHVGFTGGWSGTSEAVPLKGKNKIVDVFYGSADSNTLYLTDDANGDALFVDDIYSAFPADPQARIAQIHEIRAGAGDDLVDMTSQLFMYDGDGVTIRGGDGDDVIWSNKGSNMLFGDDGNDRIAGASGNDIIVGGTGDDSMHGGGGNDVFCFCKDWGTDTVKQLSDGTVTLWFETQTGTWDQQTMTYTDGENSVNVSGVAASSVTLKFGDDGSAQYDMIASAGAFEKFTSCKIFESAR